MPTPILAIDPAKNTGWAYQATNGAVTYGTWSATGDEHHGRFFYEFSRFLNTFRDADPPGPQVIAFEAPPFLQRDSALILFGQRSIAAAYAYSRRD